MLWHKWNEERRLSKEARTKSRSFWRYGVTALIGGYLIFSPLMLGTAGDPGSTLNAIAVGIVLLTLAARSMVNSGSRTTDKVRLALGGWLIAAPFVLVFANPVAAANAWISGVLLIATDDVARSPAGTHTLLRQHIARYRVRRLSPENIAGCKASESKKPINPEMLSRQIVERSEQIRKTLLATPSEVEVEMCLIGYKSCAADMLLLLGLLGEEFPQAGPIRRRSLKAARRKAIHSLSEARDALPPSSMQALYPGEL